MGFELPRLSRKEGFGVFLLFMAGMPFGLFAGYISNAAAAGADGMCSFHCWTKYDFWDEALRCAVVSGIALVAIGYAKKLLSETN